MPDTMPERFLDWMERRPLLMLAIANAIYWFLL